MSYQVEMLDVGQDFEVSVVRRFVTYAEFSVRRGEETLRIDLALDSPFRFETPEQTKSGLRVNDLTDLKVDKLLAFYGRVEPRDAVDLYFILQQEPLDPLLALATRKDPGFDLYWLAAALRQASEFPDEPDRWPVQMLAAFEPMEIKRQFRRIAVELMSGLVE